MTKWPGNSIRDFANLTKCDNKKNGRFSSWERGSVSPFPLEQHLGRETLQAIIQRLPQIIRSSSEKVSMV